MSVVHANGIDFHIEDRGNGTPLLLLHGFTGMSISTGIWLSGVLIYLGLGWVYAGYIVVKLAVITEYDNDFDSYIQQFVDNIGDVFNALLAFTADGQSLIKVQNNVAAFAEYVAKNDASQHLRHVQSRSGSAWKRKAPMPDPSDMVRSTFRPFRQTL